MRRKEAVLFWKKGTKKLLSVDRGGRMDFGCLGDIRSTAGCGRRQVGISSFQFRDSSSKTQPFYKNITRPGQIPFHSWLPLCLIPRPNDATIVAALKHRRQQQHRGNHHDGIHVDR
jgi:hypothetical protein